VAECEHPLVRSQSQGTGAFGGASGAAVPGVTGWQEGTQQNIPAGASTWNFLQGQTTVPPDLPPSYHGSLLFYFNALYNGGDFLQPVLQWGWAQGSGGGDFWAIASWQFDSSGLVQVTPAVRVTAGDPISMKIFLDATQTVHYCKLVTCFDFLILTWGVMAIDLNSSASANFWAETFGEMNTAFPAVFETRPLNGCPQDSVVFSNIALAANVGTTRLNRVQVPYAPMTCTANFNSCAGPNPCDYQTFIGPDWTELF
jgi:hypothetical protein